MTLQEVLDEQPIAYTYVDKDLVIYTCDGIDFYASPLQCNRRTWSGLAEANNVKDLNQEDSVRLFGFIDSSYDDRRWYSDLRLMVYEEMKVEEVIKRLDVGIK